MEERKRTREIDRQRARRWWLWWWFLRLLDVVESWSSIGENEGGCVCSAVFVLFPGCVVVLLGSSSDRDGCHLGWNLTLLFPAFRFWKIMIGEDGCILVLWRCWGCWREWWCQWYPRILTLSGEYSRCSFISFCWVDAEWYSAVKSLQGLNNENK